MVNFEDICGYEEIKRELGHLASFLRNPDSCRELGVRMPSGLLIVGRPGLGKTLMARALMQESGLPSLTCRKFAHGGDMLKEIRELFEKARESAPSILLLDDLDKFSNNSYDQCDAEEYVTVQSCIDQCKGRGVFVIATANDSDKLPKSLLRAGRFDRVITLEPPHGADALAVVRHYLGKMPCAPDASPERVSDILEGTSCALIETVANEAGLLAGFEGASCLSLLHFVRAYAKVEGNGTLSELSVDEPAHIEDAWISPRAQVAFHEAGHFVMREALCKGGASLALIVERQGRLAGFSKDRHLTLHDRVFEAKASILVALAGGVAVEQQYGIPCMGCSSDDEAALKLVSNLIKDAGLLGRRYAGMSEWSGSESLSDARERACSVVLEQLRWEVRRLLAEKRPSVEAVAARLYQKGYVLADDLEGFLTPTVR